MCAYFLQGDGASISEVPVESYFNKPVSSEIKLKIEFDAVAITLFIIAIGTRFYKLEEPHHIV